MPSSSTQSNTTTHPKFVERLALELYRRHKEEGRSAAHALLLRMVGGNLELRQQLRERLGQFLKESLRGK